MIDPVINSFVQQYLTEYEIESEGEYTDFELFANYCVFSSFNRRTEDFDVTKVHTGQTKDTGLDGIGIFIDDVLVNSEEDAEQIIGDNKNRTLKLKFIFVQAKLKNSFEFEVVKKTIDAVQDFFADYRDIQPIYSRSEQVKEKAALASYLLKKYIINTRDKKPECHIYYICISHKDADSTIKLKQARLVKELEEKLRFLSGINFYLWGSDKIEKLYRQTKRQVEATIRVSKYFTLKVPGVKRAYITAVSFEQFKNIILDEDKNIRDVIFYDNIRGFLGVGEDNSINEAIKETLKSTEEVNLFPLLNNGITIITHNLNIIDDDKYQLIDYQVVNGCQTSHVLDMCKDFPNIDDI
ncbi:AIPR family protein, partial [Trichormus variabilis PNB]